MHVNCSTLSSSSSKTRQLLERCRAIIKTCRPVFSSSSPPLNASTFYKILICHNAWNWEAVLSTDYKRNKIIPINAKINWHLDKCIVRHKSDCICWKKLVKLDLNSAIKKELIPTWFEHAAFWSGVRRATVAPRSLA